MVQPLPFPTPRADAAPVSAAIERALGWAAAHPAPADSLPLLADEAWFYQMLTWRWPGAARALRSGWREARQRCLSAALEAGVGAPPDAPPLACCEHLIAATMLAHLLRRSAPDGGASAPGAPTVAPIERFVATMYGELCARAAQVFNVSFLFNYVLLYNLGKLELAAPVPASTRASYRGLPDSLRFVVEAYHHTHRILFASDTLRLAELRAEPHRESLDFIRAHVPRALAENRLDIAAEFASCLMLCREGGERVLEVVHELVREQHGDGSWSDATEGERATRHCSFMSTLALVQWQQQRREAP